MTDDRDDRDDVAVEPSPADELENEGSAAAIISDVLADLANRNGRDAVTGRFLPLNVEAGGTLEHSEQFWSALAPLKAKIVQRTRRQFVGANVDGDDDDEMLDDLIDVYAEAKLLRQSQFLKLVFRGGPVTSKGKARANLQAWGLAVDRELRAIEKLKDYPRQQQKNTRKGWLTRAVDEAESE